jgi:glutamine synthetase
VDKSTAPGDRLDIDMYTEGHTVKNAKKLPLNLLDALRHLESDTRLCDAMGHEFSQAYLKLKHNDWNKYSQSLTPWERENTLDC